MRRLIAVGGTVMILAGVGACSSGTSARGETPRASTTPAPRASADAGAPVRGIYRFNSDDWSNMAAVGFTHVTDGNSNQAAQKRAGLVGVIWAGGWNKGKCSFEWSAGQMAAVAEANRGHGYYYQLGDEPNVFQCKNAADEYRRATQLIHQHDPTGNTWVAIDQFNDENLAAWPGPDIPLNGAVDVLAFDVYPCHSGQCRYDMIDAAVRRIHAAGVRDWQFILQDFGHDDYRWPTADELRKQFQRWQGQGASGYWVFAWDYQKGDVTRQPGHLDALRWMNQQGI